LPPGIRGGLADRQSRLHEHCPADHFRGIGAEDDLHSDKPVFRFLRKLETKPATA
jgi:hypothetical protein